MVDFRNALVQGGLLYREGQKFDEEQSQAEYSKAVRAHGVKKLESDERRMIAEDSMLDTATEIKRIQQDIAKNEALFVQSNQDTNQSIQKADLQQQAKLQPGRQQIESNTQAAAGVAAQSAADLAPGQAQVAKVAQGEALRVLQEKQAVNIFNLIKLGDMEGALKMMNDSQSIHPGRKFSGIQIGQAPDPAAQGQSMPVFKLTPSDGGKEVYVPVKQLEALSRKHGSTIQKAGNNIVRIDADGTATPIYEPDQYGTAAEGATTYNKRTGVPAAGGVRVSGPKGRTSKEDTRLNNNVKMAIDKVLLPKYGGRFEGGMFFPDEKNKDVALRATVLTEEYIKQKGMEPVAAAAAGVEQAEREQKLKQPGSGGAPAAGGAYTGPTPWRQ